MPIIDKKEFSKICGKPVNKLWTYIDRGKIILLGDGKLDTDDPRNKAFLEKWTSRTDVTYKDISITVPKNQQQTKNIPESTPLVDVESHEGQSYTESERQLKYLDTLKRRKEIEKLEFEVQKKRGEVVPSELIKPVFLQHNQSILTEYKNATDEIIRIFSKKRSLTVDEVAEIKTDLVKTINNAINNAIIISSKSIDSIISDHSDKRGIGEHG